MLKLIEDCPNLQIAHPPIKNVCESPYIFSVGGANFHPKKDIQNNPPPKKECMGNAIHFFSKSQKSGGGKLVNFASYFDHFAPPLHIYLVNSWGGQS